MSSVNSRFGTRVLSLVLFGAISALGQDASDPVAAAPQKEVSRAARIATSSAPSPLPRLVKFSGTVLDLNGAPRTGTVGMIFSIYPAQMGGSSLWMETQNVELDSHGRYTVLLGAAHSDGLPLDLFNTGEARWLGVQAQLSGDPEQQRVLLVSVPYAMKAGDAETLGGRPASAYLLADGTKNTSSGTKLKSGSEITAAINNSGVTSGTPNFIAKFDSASTVVNSLIYDDGSKVGIGTTTPTATLDVHGTIQADNVMYNSVDNVFVKDIIFPSVTGTPYTVHGRFTTFGGDAFDGFRGETDHPFGNAMEGVATGVQAAGVYGQAYGTDGWGVYAESNDTTGAGYPYAIYGALDGPTGAAVYGISTSTDAPGNVVGVEGVVSHPNGIAGVFDNIAGGKIFSGRQNGIENIFIDSSGNVNAQGSITATAFIGNGAGLTNIPGSAISGTVSPANIGAGTANINISGNSAGFLGNLAGDVTGPQSATTLASVGTPGTYTKLTTDTKGRVTAGAQAQFSDLGGAVTSAQLPSNVAYKDINNNFTANQSVTGKVTATSFSGSGIGLNNILGTVIVGDIPGNAAGFSGALSGDVTGTQGATVISSVDAAKMTTGTVADARLSSNVAKRDGGNSFTNGTQTLAAATTGFASLNMATGTAPSTPVAGDFWNESGVVKFNPDGVLANTKTLAFTDSIDSSVATETARATAAEGVLTTNLANEVTRATGTEGTLATNLATTDTNVAANTAVIGANTTAIATNAANIISETTRATAAEGTLTTNLGNEVTRATGAESTLTTNLNGEVSRATLAEGTLSTNLSNEVTRAQSAENTLTTNLNGEITRATGVEAGLTTGLATANTNISANTSAIATNTTDIASNTAAITINAAAITAETTRATGAESTLTSNLATANTNIAANTAAITSNAGAILSEVTRATGAEAGLATSLASATTAIANKANLVGGNTFTTGTQTLAASTNTYASLNMSNGAAPSAPIAGDFWNESGVVKFNPDGVAANTKTLAFTDSIDSSVATETARATAAESLLTTNLANEVTRAIGVEGTLTGNLATTNSNVTTNTAAIGANTTAIATNAANITAETTRATTAEGTLTTNLSNEVTRATGAENTLTTNLNGEVTRATAAEGMLTTNLSNEVTRATSAESTLTANLSNEVTRATGVEAGLTSGLATANTNIAANTSAIATNATAITAETTRATGAESTLTSNLATANTNITANTAAITSNAGAILSEVTRATGAEAGLASNLATANTAIAGKANLAGGNSFSGGTQILAAATNTYASLNMSTGAAPTTPVAGDFWNESGVVKFNPDGVAANTKTLAFTDSIVASVATETARATAAEGVLTTNLANEVTRATGTEGTLTTNLATTDTNVAANTAAISANTTAIATNAANITSETTRATAAEGTLTTNLSNEVIRATGAENTLTTNLNGEVTRATGVEAGLTSGLATANTNIAANTAAIATNAAAISAETTRATGAESTLTSNLATANTNIAANTAAISANATAISAETTRATGAEGTLTTNLAASNANIAANTLAISTEVTRATAAENTLTTNLATANASIATKADLAGGNSFSGGKQTLAAGTTGYASLNMATGLAPTAPVAGDIWNQSGVVKFNPDGVLANTKTVAFLDSTLTGNAAGFTGSLAGDVTGAQGSTLVSKIQGTPVSATAPTSTQVLAFNGTQWQPATPTTGTVTNVATGAGLTGGPITSTGTISIASAGVTNAMLANNSVTVTAGTGLSGGGAVALGGSTTVNLANTAVTAGTYTKLTVDAQGRATAGTSAAFSDLSGSVAATQLPALTGDITSTAGSAATTLANSGVTAGTYNKVTVDAKGRVTAGAALTSLTADVSGVLPIVNGGTGSSAQNFVDLSTTQSIAGAKSFTGTVDASAATSTMPVRVSSTFPAACVAQQEMLIRTGSVTAGQQLFLCNSAGTGWNLIGDGLGNNNNLSFNPVTIAANTVNLVKNVCTTGYTGAYPAFVAGQDIPIPPASGSLSSTSTLVASVLSSTANSMPSAWDSYTFQAYVDNSGTKSFLHVCNLTLTSFGSSGAITFNVRAIN